MRRRQCARHDARCEIKATTQRRIVSLFNQVNLPVLEVPIRTNHRIAREERRQQRHNVRDAERRRHADFQHAGRLAAIVRDGRDRCLQRIQIAADFHEKALACLGQRELARRALEQPHAEIAFQQRNVPADRGGRQRKTPRGRGEAARFGAADKRLEVGEGFHPEILKHCLKIIQAIPG